MLKRFDFNQHREILMLDQNFKSSIISTRFILVNFLGKHTHNKIPSKTIRYIMPNLVQNSFGLGHEVFKMSFWLLEFFWYFFVKCWITLTFWWDELCWFFYSAPLWSLECHFRVVRTFGSHYLGPKWIKRAVWHFEYLAIFCREVISSLFAFANPWLLQ